MRRALIDPGRAVLHRNSSRHRRHCYARPPYRDIGRKRLQGRRDPWSGAFSDVLEHHLGPACTKAGIEIDELAGIIGNDWAATLWGCAFEDFLTRELSEVGNIIEEPVRNSERTATRTLKQWDRIAGRGGAGRRGYFQSGQR
jgi:hypothetical protein